MSPAAVAGFERSPYESAAAGSGRIATERAVVKIGILGTGGVAQTLGTGLVSLGHDVMLGSRQAGGEKATAWVKATGNGASEGTLQDAARFGEMVVVATPGAAVAETVNAVGPENLAGKVVLDVSNPLDFSAGFARLAISGADSAGETIQRLAPEARVVKALNTVNQSVMVRPNWEGGTPDMMIAGNDAAAKEAISAILRQWGWNPIDLGGIVSARWLEAMILAWIALAVPSQRYTAAFKVIDLQPGG